MGPEVAALQERVTREARMTSFHGLRTGRKLSRAIPGLRKCGLPG
jgi:hypothetical protein